MAVLKDSSYLYQSRLRRPTQASPSPTNFQQKPRLRVNERRFACKEIRRLKSPNIHSMKSENTCIANEKPVAPKKLPHYMLLPAIGKHFKTHLDPVQSAPPTTSQASVELPSTTPTQTPVRQSTSRQLTYTVLNPRYVKGPKDQPTKPGIIMPLLKWNFPKQPIKKKKAITKHKYQENKQEDESRWTVLKPFSKTINGPQIIVSTELINAFEHLETENLNQRNGAFWIQF